MQASLVCFSPACRAKYALSDVIYQCPVCGGLLEVDYDWTSSSPQNWPEVWRERRLENSPRNQSGVWRYREVLPFDDEDPIVTLREGCTPLLDAPKAAQYAGVDAITFKHQGFNPTGSF